jgi:nucleoside-diphosphate-sugar epimerase
MAALSVLFVGGTGRISSACVKRAVECGFEVSALNRGQTTYRPLPSEVRQFTASIEDADAVRAVLGENVFDVVADFMIFEPSRVPVVVDVFGRRTGQFIFISSASCYQKPIARLPITESTPLANPYWQYSRNKIAC